MKHQLRTKTVTAEPSSRKRNSLVGLYLLIRKMKDAVEVGSKVPSVGDGERLSTAYQGADTGTMWAF